MSTSQERRRKRRAIERERDKLALLVNSSRLGMVDPLGAYRKVKPFVHIPVQASRRLAPDSGFNRKRCACKETRRSK
jgi:anti-sigma-K factor RskA